MQTYSSSSATTLRPSQGSRSVEARSHCGEESSPASRRIDDGRTRARSRVAGRDRGPSPVSPQGGNRRDPCRCARLGHHRLVADPLPLRQDVRALALASGQSDPSLASYALLHGVAAEFARKKGDLVMAARLLDRALACPCSEPQRRFLERRRYVLDLRENGND